MPISIDRNSSVISSRVGVSIKHKTIRFFFIMYTCIETLSTENVLNRINTYDKIKKIKNSNVLLIQIDNTPTSNFFILPFVFFCVRKH